MNKYIEKLEANKDKLIKLKEELAKKQHKVQLGIVDDLQDSIGEADSLIQLAKGELTELKQQISEYENAGDVLSAAYRRAENIASDMESVQDVISADMQALEKSARDLGVDFDEIPAYREADNMFDELDNRIVEIEEEMDNVPKDLI